MSNNGPRAQSFNRVYITGIQGKRFDISIRDGVFHSIAESSGPVPDEGTVPAQDLWISPGIIDLHTHLAWTDFDHTDQLKRDIQEIEEMQARALEATLRTGVTTARDAGGLLPGTAQHLVQTYQVPLRVHTSSEMLGAADAKGTIHLDQRLKQIYDTGAGWVKIMATGGLGAPTEKVTDPVFSEEEFSFIVRHAHEHGKRVLVHTWGGVTVDWSVDAGVESIEHGMFLTESQAGRLAESGVAFVPTTSIYRIAADPKGVLALNPVICDRAARAAEAHSNAIAYAKRAGVQIGFGTDYATPALHGYNLQELDTLMDYGLTRAEAWQAATGNAAEILGWGHRLGRIAEGYIADAVIFDADPYMVDDADSLRKHIVSVLTGAREL
ncbi:imidazolonepropionase-like amidohydrolase [Fontibacillus phaseoli]|uniref:Imidazolonepropionase-like amidohydrolase n=1 Tax=Fontibacillus phaseoli TaxID=1416533 RepID=A0A369BMF7_9BACL|nr:amidohydrolase family protein [Fontibacillus phaseoli]RCX21637.1 imidazolonepropionase-like amidohydrolase [Fontibacillus phaseoli]